MIEQIPAIAIGTVTYCVWLVIEKSVLEPVAKEMGTAAFSRYIVPAWKWLDYKLTLPGAWEEFLDKGAEWIYKCVLPEEVKARLGQEASYKLCDYLYSRFSVKVHQNKRYGSQKISGRDIGGSGI